MAANAKLTSGDVLLDQSGESVPIEGDGGRQIFAGHPRPARRGPRRGHYSRRSHCNKFGRTAELVRTVGVVIPAATRPRI